ncbi:hypothetical protein LPJ78_005304 [Coemansia sp. RSA 989]|nr:hypothetical protein LPJ78_005304 [Coemansia sp. RSA 989]KAJ1870490.1 hypothetical protein LPJ55_004625 [Coemansia sp. RSA 990]
MGTDNVEWAGEFFKPIFDPVLHPALAVLFAAMGLVYAGKFVVTRGNLNNEAQYAAVASAALGLATIFEKENK